MLSPRELRPLCQTGKDRDPGWYIIHRRLSIYLTWALLHTRITLDQVSLLMIACGVVGAALQLPTHLPTNALGWLLLYSAFLLDKVDGEMARYRRQESVTGILLDRFHHRLAEPLLFLAVGVHEYRNLGSVTALVAAFATMLAANAIEETQQLPAFIAHKFARETKRWPDSGRRPSAGLERLATVMKTLKVFRTFITVLPMVVVTYVIQSATGAPAPTMYLIAASVSLWVYLLFQARYYYAGRLEADVHHLGRQLEEVTLPPVAAAGESPAAPHETPTRDAHAKAALPAAGVLLALAIFWPAGARAATYYVDTSNPSCSSAGPGTEAQPYCTITSALAARAAAGNTIVVKPGVYREQVTVPASGASGAPLVLQASGPGVIIDGADDFSLSSKWVLHTGSIYRAPSVVWSPKAVYVDGVRYTASNANTSSIPAGSYRYTAGSGLFLNAGGGNPGTRQVFVGRRTYGIYLTGRSWVTVDGFAVTRTEDRGIFAFAGSNDVTIRNNTVTLANKYGIQVSESVRGLIASNVATDNYSHGIAVTTNAANCVIEGNESARNAVPGTRAANGLYLYGATACVVQRNRWHDNQDSGEHVQLATNIVSIGNMSWNNGDHGFDHLSATGTQHVGDVAFGNYRDGFSIEGSSPSCIVANCIGVNNGLTTNGFNLWVDQASSSGLTSNDNLFWNSTAQAPIKHVSTVYSTIAAFAAATGKDTRSIQADPRFVAAASGNFHLQPGSPAIDNANSSVANWPATDSDDFARMDDPSTTNSGLGPVDHADRGALEYQPGGVQPIAMLSATPAMGTAPVSVTLSAVGSSDPGGSIVSYQFAFGDGGSSGAQASPTVLHTYAAGTWAASVTVINNTGMTASAGTTVIANQPPVAGLTLAPTSGSAPLTVATDASSSTDLDGSIVSYEFDFGDGTVVGPQAGPTATHVFGLGNWSMSVTVTDDRGASSSASDSVQVTEGLPNQSPVAALVLTPNTGSAPLGVTADASGSSDPESSPLLFVFNFGDGTVVGPQTHPLATHSYAAGEWTAQVTVIDAIGAVDTTARPVMVTAAGEGPNLVGNPSFEINTTGWSAYSSATLQRVAGGYDGSFALQMTGPATTSSFGLNDSPNWVTTTAGVGTRYRLSAWVRSPGALGTAKLQVREYVGATKIGATVFSPGVALSPTWRLITVDHVVQAASSTLDVQILDAPLVAGETFQADNVSIRVVPPGSGPAALAPAPDENFSGVPDHRLAESMHVFRAGVSPRVARPEATLFFELTEAGPVRVELFDTTGRRRRVLYDNPATAAGVHRVPLDGRDQDGRVLGSGIYFYRVQAPEQAGVGRYFIIR